MATVRELAIRVTGDSSSYSRSMGQASSVSTEFYRGQQERARRFDVYMRQNTNSVEALNHKMSILGKTGAAVIGSLVGGFAVSNVLKIADDYGQMAIRVKMALESATGSSEQFQDVQNRLFEMSNVNSRSLAQTQTLYIQTASSMKELGLTTDQTIGVIGTLNNELTIGAADAQSTEGAINSLTKAMIKGKIGSDELMSIMKAMPSLMTHIAANMGITEISLKNMVVNNKISLNELLLEIEKLESQTTEMAKRMPNTIADGFQQVSNSLSRYLGETNEATQISANLSSGLSFLSDNFETVANTAVVLMGVGLARYLGSTTQSMYSSITASIQRAQTLRAETLVEKERITSLLTTITTERAQLEVKKQNILIAQAHSNSVRAQLSLNQQLVAVEAQLTAAKNAETAATARLTAANKSLSLVSRAGSSLLGLMGGPVGLIATVGVLAASFIDFSGDADEATRALVDMSLPVDELIKKYNDLDKAKKAAFKNQTQEEIKINTSEIEDKLSEVQSHIETALSDYTVVMGSGFWSMTPENDNAFSNWKNSIQSLLEQVKNGTITQDEFGKKLAESNELALSAANTDKQRRVNIENLSGAFTDLVGEIYRGSEALKQINSINDDAQKQAAEIAKQEKERKEQIALVTGEYESQINVLNKILEQYNKVDAITSATNFINSEAAAHLTDEKRKAFSETLKQVDIAKKASEQAKADEKIRQDAIKASIDLEKEQQRQREQAQTKYNEIVNSLRTIEQRQLDEYKEKYDLIQKMASSEAERVANTQKLAEQTVNQAVGSASSVLLNSLTPMQRADSDEESEIDKLNSWYELVQEIYTDNQEKLLEQQQAYEDAKTAIQEDFTEKRKKILDDEANSQLQATSNLLTSAGDMFGGVADIIGKFSNESGAAYKAMFALSKGFAIADAALKLQSALMQAMADPSALTPAQKFANYAVVASAGGSLLSSISSIGLTGMAHDGIDNIPREGTWLLQKGERVLNPKQNKSFTEAMSKITGNGSSNVIVNNYGSDAVNVRQDKDRTIIDIAVKEAVGKVNNSIAEKSGSTWEAFKTTNLKPVL